MKKLLIIRSASFQQLDLNLPHILQRFKNYQVTLLTHEHGLRQAEKYSGIHRVIVYPYLEGFDDKYTMNGLQGMFDAVVFLVTNLSGDGYENVLRFASTLHVPRIYFCNVVSEINEVSGAAVSRKMQLEKLYKSVSIVFVVLISPLLIFYSGSVVLKHWLLKHSVFK